MFAGKIYLHAALIAIRLGFALHASAETGIFEPEKFFTGHTRSVGVFRNSFGRREQRFTTDCRGRMRGDTLFLDQYFRYADGRKQERHWQIRRLTSHRYIGRANDVVGEARGEVRGRTFRFSYVVALKPGNPFLNVRLNQSMTLRGDGSVENHATIRKLGLVLSRVSEEFQRAD